MEGPALTGTGSLVESGSRDAATIHVSDVSDSVSGDGSYASGEFLMPRQIFINLFMLFYLFYKNVFTVRYY